MSNIAMTNLDTPSTYLALMILISVLSGTLLLIAVAFIRRWQQLRFSRYVHILQREYRPLVAKILSGVPCPSAVEALREIPLADRELVLDPYFSKRKLTDRQRVFLQALCAEIGLISLWQTRTASNLPPAAPLAENLAKDISPRNANESLLQAKSIRNLGILGHRPSWMLLARALDARHPDIQLVALRSLAALRAPESFNVLQTRLHAVIEGQISYPPIQPLLAAMTSFEIDCVPALLPSLSHANRQIRLHSTEVMKMMVSREAIRQPAFALTEELLTPPVAEVLLTGLASDLSAEIRARAAEILVYLVDPRTPPVLHSLLFDPLWFVRLRTLRALAHWRQPAAPLNLDIREFLGDPHWQVREAAIQALVSLGSMEKHQLYEYYLSSPDRSVQEQIAEVMQRSGLMSELVEEYSAGAKGVHALVVEELASHSAYTGLSLVLRNVDPEIQRRFMERFRPTAQPRMLPQEEAQRSIQRTNSFQEALEFPPQLAA